MLRKFSSFLTVFLFMGSIMIVNAQGLRCGYDLMVHQFDDQHPGYKNAIDKTFKDVKKAANHPLAKLNDSTLRVPVVFHIVHYDEVQNLPDSVIHSQIEVLNEDYNRKNPTKEDTREIFEHLAGSVNIEFYLADTDPEGNPTSGITRTQTDIDDFLGQDFLFSGDFSGLERVKKSAEGGQDPWPQDKYCNIWVTDMSMIIPPPFGTGEKSPAILGLATPPLEAPNWPPDISELGLSDGIILHYQIVGRNNSTNEDLPAEFQDVVGLGRTLTHEMGHYLGLRHIWGDGGDIFGLSDSCDEDDGLEDTPNSGYAANQACDLTLNTCNDGGADDLPDMIENYMDYADENCQNMFTHDQIWIMRGILLGPRATLLEKDKQSNMFPEFTADKTEVITGEEVTFTDMSEGDVDDYLWQFGDGDYSLEANPKHTYLAAGKYTVSLTIVNEGGDNSIFKTDYITVEEDPIIGIDETTTPLFNFNIIPNPSSGNIKIDLSPDNQILNHLVQLNVFNATGQNVYTDKNYVSQTTIETNNWANGIYFVQITQANQTISRKLTLYK